MDATSLKQLEDAARAAGHVPVGVTDDGTALLLKGIQQPWNPRDENPHADCMGDALRLVVKLELTIGHADLPPRVWVEHDWRHLSMCEHSDNPYAATRRAIVRAAAAIGAMTEARR